MITDTDVHVPPNYTTTAPPAVGGSYVDPVFGTMITRLTDAVAAGGSRIVPEYSQSSSYNLDDTYIILKNPTFTFSLHEADGTFIRGLPAGTKEPRWSRITAKYLYYHDGNQVYRYDADLDSSVNVGPSFAETISFGKDTGDVSDNDRIVVLRADRYVSIWDLAAGTQVSASELDTNAAPINGSNIDWVTIAKDGDSFVVGYAPKGSNRGQGAEQYDVDGNFMIQVLNTAPHAAMGRDTDGTPIFFVSTAGTVPNEPAGCGAGIAKISLDGLATKTCLLILPWGMGRHLSAHGNDGWVYISTEQVPNPDVPPVENPDYNAGDDNDWHVFTDEIFRVSAAGTQAAPIIERLAHTLRRSTRYWMEPHANISISGNRLVFGSDLGQPIDVGAYADTYLINTQPGDVPMSDLAARQDALTTATPPIAWSADPEMVATGNTILSYQDASGGPVVEMYDAAGELLSID